MQVQLGNPTPVVCDVDHSGAHTGHHPHDLGGAPAVTYATIPEGDDETGTPLYGFDPAVDLAQLALDVLRSRDGIGKHAGHEALMSVISPAGMVAHHHGPAGVSWVKADNPDFARVLGSFFNCPVLDPDDRSYEDTHYTLAGPPGVVPGARLDLRMNITQNGRDIWARNMGGGAVGAVGTATGTTATTLTNSGAGYTTNQFAGMRIVTSTAWMNVISNTATAITGDRWYSPATPGGVAASTPGSTATYAIIDGGAPAWFMGLSADTGTPASPSTATSLASEIVTAGGGLVRKICPYAHTASANTFTLTPVFTANGSDSLPVTIAKAGVFDSMVVATAATMLFETLISTTATLSASGDALTITETVTGT